MSKLPPLQMPSQVSRPSGVRWHRQRLAKLPLRLAACVLTVAACLPVSVANAEGFPTIDGQFSGIGTIPPNGVLNLTVLGRGGVPSSGVDAVAINVTATNPTVSSFLTVWPAGSTRPTASNLNFEAGQTTPNMVIAKVGVSGQISLFNLAGNVDVIVDVLGWFPAGGSYTGLSPARLLDTRAGSPTIDGQFAGLGAVAAGQTANVTVTGRGGVPAAGVDAVVLNVTATGSTASSYVTAWPAGTDRPTASNLNFIVGQTTPNLVIAKVGVRGQISLFNLTGNVDVIVDVLGWFPNGGSYTGLTPARLLESRPGLPTVDGAFAATGPVGPGATTSLTVTGRGGVPASGVGAVAVNVTATGGTAESYVTVWPAGSNRPTASNLNFTAGQTTPNMVIAAVGSNGQISLYNLAGRVDVIVDVLGWFPIGNSYNGLSPARLLDTRVVPAPLPPPPPTPPPPPAVVTLQPGTLVVNSSVAPGRYIAANAAYGCYWERLSGFGGSLDEINANDFQGFTGQVIVDILASDAGFSFDPECGTFKTYIPPVATAGSITPGAHVVGAHIAAGTYTTNAAAGCYWERTTSFDGTFSAIIANDFVSSAGPLVVTISPTDVGFHNDADCGTWIRV